MRRWGVLAAVVILAAGPLAGCSPRRHTGSAVVVVNGGEPQNPLIPTNTNETYGGRLVDRLFAGLMSYDAAGQPVPEVAESVESADGVNYRITLKPDWTFSDGTPVTAHSFVDAWNYGAQPANAQSQRNLFSPIDGYDDAGTAPPGVDAAPGVLSGLQVIDDRRFTVRLRAPTVDFVQRLASAPFAPLPDVAFADMVAFGRRPIGNGPYRIADGAEGAAWRPDGKVDLVANSSYHGNRMPRNRALRFVFYTDLDAAYTDLLAGVLDVLDTLPPRALGGYRTELDDRAVTAPGATSQTLDTPFWLPHFGGEEGRLRRLALSAAIDRPRICRQVFAETCTPARDFTAEAVRGFDPDLDGDHVLDFDPEGARRLWARADAISPWAGRYVIAYNADGAHRDDVEAVADSLRATLGIDVAATPYPTFAVLRARVAGHGVATAFRSGWRPDYPSALEFLVPQFRTGAGANDVGYTNPEFDAAVDRAETAPSPQDAAAQTDAAQRILLHDMPTVPLWNATSIAGCSPAVSDVALTWNGLPDYERIVKR